MQKSVTDLQSYIRQQLPSAALSERTCTARGQDGERAFMLLNENIKYGSLTIPSGTWLNITDPNDINFISAEDFVQKYTRTACIVPSEYGRKYCDTSKRESPCKNCDFKER